MGWEKQTLGKLLKWLAIEVSCEAKGYENWRGLARASRGKKHHLERCGDLKTHMMYRAQKVINLTGTEENKSESLVRVEKLN